MGCAKFGSPQAMERKVGCGCCHQQNLFFPATPGTPRSNNNNDDDYYDNNNHNFLLLLLINCSEGPAQCRERSGSVVCVKFGL